MKPELLPTKPVQEDDQPEDNSGNNNVAEVTTENTNGQFDGSADGFHGKSLPDREAKDVVNKAFLTEVKDSARSEKKMLTKEDEDLGIYEDPDAGDDDLSDTELELEKLRAEKLKREMEEKETSAEEKFKQQAQNLVKSKDDSDIRNGKPPENIRSLTESALQLLEKEFTPRTDISLESRMSVKTWSDPRFLQGFSLRELCWKTGQTQEIVTTSMEAEIKQSRNASRLALESREAMFRRAMSLLSARCSSVRQDGADGDNALNIGAQVPKYFYVTQEKPLPMEPLKAWRGYHGNIYFEPININPLKADIELQRAQTSVTRTSVPPAQRTRTSVPKARLSKDKENRPLLESRSESRQTNKSSHGSQMSSSRPLAILDKHSVLNRLNENIHEDIVWLEGTENTGSLAVRPKTYPDRESKQRERDLQYNKERIRKGSVAHKLYVDSKSKQQPKLSVNGGKFTPPNSLSPLLRTQTQYSLSSHRLTTNSPDPYHLNDSKLPPLDQIRASLKHMDARREQGSQRAKIPYSKSVTITDDMKPFVKYSPDVVAKFAQQANIC